MKKAILVSSYVVAAITFAKLIYVSFANNINQSTELLIYPGIFFPALFLIWHLQLRRSTKKNAARLAKEKAILIIASFIISVIGASAFIIFSLFYVSVFSRNGHELISFTTLSPVIYLGMFIVGIGLFKANKRKEVSMILVSLKIAALVAFFTSIFTIYFFFSKQIENTTIFWISIVISAILCVSQRFWKPKKDSNDFSHLFENKQFSA